jgi:4-nitrophenyl phosphatase
VLFVTNNSAATIADHEEALHEVGVPARGDVVSSATAAARLIQPGERVLVTGGPGITEAVEQRGGSAIVNDGVARPGTFDSVVVGLHRDFDYPRLAVAATAVRSGARLIGTNGDSTYPTADGLAPGGGAILAAVAEASGASPQIAGKPYPPMATVIGEMLSTPAGQFDPSSVLTSSVLMVGDRPETDGLFAAELRCAFVLVRSGVVAPGQSVDPEIDVAVDLPDLAALSTALADTAR